MKFETVSPESLGIDSNSILDFIDRMEKAAIELHSISVLRHGTLCAIGAVKPYSLSIPHIMFSFSKTLTATGIGFAEQEGLLSLDEKLVDIFPEYAPEDPSENCKNADIWSLLTMTSGHGTEIPIEAQTEEWIYNFLHHEFVYEPRTTFLYNTAGTNMLAAIIKKRTGLEITEYLRPRLFTPLGMSDIHGLPLPDGTIMGGSGMFLTTKEQALFGQFLLQRGKWEGRQLLNDAWFDRAVIKEVETVSVANPSPTLNWSQGYCFQCWKNCAKDVYRCDGAYGQFAFVCPNEDALVTITSASENTEYLVEAFEDTILKSIHEGPYEENEEARKQLIEKLENASLPALWSIRSPMAEEALNGKRFVFTSSDVQDHVPSFEEFIGGGGAENICGNALRAMTFAFREDRLILTVEGAERTVDIAIGLGGEILMTPYTVNVTQGETETVIGASGRWEDAVSLHLELRNVRCVTGARITLSLECNDPANFPDALTLKRRPTICQPRALHDTDCFELKLKKA